MEGQVRVIQGSRDILPCQIDTSTGMTDVPLSVLNLQNVFIPLFIHPPSFNELGLIYSWTLVDM